jgi:hypothetical protein
MDFEPMKSGSLKSLKSTSFPFERETVADMRDIHDTLLEDQIQQSYKNDYLHSFFLNNTSIISEPYYAGLGFIDGAFFKQD